VSQETSNRTFDELARGLASGSITRGKALKLMGAALLGGTLASVVGIGEAAADPTGCKRNGKHCKRDNQCCSGHCSSSGTCGVRPVGCASNGVRCGSASVCCSGHCESTNAGPANFTFCCAEVLSPCSQATDCCGSDTICSNGRCDTAVV
jgi:hypothetical protein